MAKQNDFTLEAVVYLNVPDPVLIERMRGRARPDDTDEVIKHRLDVFTETTRPLIAYYQERGILVEIDGNQAPDDITAEIKARLPS